MPYGSGSGGGGGGLSAIAANSLLGNNSGSSAVPTAEQYPVLGAGGYVVAANTGALQITGTVASYWQVTLQNLSNDAAASTDVVVTANDGDDSTHFADFGINGSAGGATPFIAGHEAYLYTTDDKLSIGALGAAAVIGFYTGTTPTLAGSIDVNQQWKFSGNGAASVSSVLFNGTAFTGGTGTTTFPKLFLQPTGTTAATTWSTAGTQIGINAANGFAGNFLDFHVTGAASVFKVDSTGQLSGSQATFGSGQVICGNLAASFRISSTYAGAASTSVIATTGTLLTGGTGTTNFPQYLAQTGAATAATTWSTAGTYVGLNANTGFTGNFVDYRINGAGTTYIVSYQGSFGGSTFYSNASSGKTLAYNGGVIGWTAGGDATLIADAGFSRLTANSVALGNGTAGDFSGALKLASVTATGAYISGAPSGGTAAAWKFGSLVTAAVVVDTTRYVQLDVGGTLYKMIVAS